MLVRACPRAPLLSPPEVLYQGYTGVTSAPVREALVRTSTLILTALLSLVAACKDEPSAAPTAASATPSTTPSVVANASAAPSVSADVAPLGKMAHCPSAITGAKTAIKDVPSGVELDVTGADAPTVAEIRARAKVLADVAKNPALQAKHNGSGGGGGTFGRCPVVMKLTTVDIVDMDEGTKITVKAKSDDQVDWLRRETRERQADIGPASTQGAGERKMANCPSAVDGSTTVVANTKVGAKITVTAKDAAATTEIRGRAKHIVDASKLDAGPVTHTGDGHGGGGLGRCPVPLDGTSVSAKDIPGGTEITAKAIDATQVSRVQNEAHERATNFGASAAPSASAAPAKP